MSNLEKVITEIKNEIKVNEKGQSFITKGGLARLLGIDHSNFNRGKWSKKLTETLTRYGFDIGVMDIDGIPDAAVSVIANYFAHEARQKSEQANQVLMAFSAIGIRTWFQQIAGYEQVEEKPKNKIEELKGLIQRSQDLLKIFEYADNKPGLNNMLEYAVDDTGQLKLPTLLNIDDILERLNKKFNADERKIIGMYAATQYRTLTGKKPPQVRKIYTQDNGKRQSVLVAAYPIDFLPVIENAINLGFNS